MAKTSSLQNATLWFFTIVFLIFGVLNAIQVHIIPGLFYIVLALLYLPYTGIALRSKSPSFTDSWASPSGYPGEPRIQPNTA